VFADGEQLDMGEAGLQGIGDQLLRQLPVVQETTVLLAPPGPQVEFQDAQGRRVAIALPAFLHPRVIAPDVVPQAMDDGGRAGGTFALEGEGIGLQGYHAALRALDLEFVELSDHQVRDEELPDAVHGVLLHGMAAAVPVVEGAHDAHSARVRSPDGEGHARHAVEDPGMGAQAFVGTQVGPLAQQVAVQLAQDGTEAVGIFGFPGLAAPMQAVAVLEGGCGPGEDPFEQPFWMHPAHFGGQVPGIVMQDFHPLRPGYEGADQETSLLGQGMHAEPIHGVRAVTPEKSVNVEAGGVDGHPGSKADAVVILLPRSRQTRKASVTLQAWASQPLCA